MTRVSGEKAQTWLLLDLPGVARFSLLMFGVTFLGNPSCLLTTATDFPEPVPSPPFADANTALATPLGGSGVPVTQILRVDDDTQQVTLSADVRSDDVGRELRSRAFINYKLSKVEGINYDEVFGGEDIPASTFDDVRSISASINPRLVEDGCYQVALVITHEFDEAKFIPRSQDDTALLIWWMVKGDPAATNFGQCPGVPPSLDQDAGADGGGL
jgi:hypothetical protein